MEDDGYGWMDTEEDERRSAKYGGRREKVTGDKKAE
jgi:hypothetical protein